MEASYFTTCLCASALLLLAGSAANAACTNATLVGAYGILEQGQFIGGGFSEFRAVGELTFDGKGKGTRSSTIWYSTLEIAVEGVNPISYAVQPDCTFTWTYVNGETYTGVIVSGGQKAFYLETSNGDPMRTGQAERVRGGQ